MRSYIAAICFVCFFAYGPPVALGDDRENTNSSSDSSAAVEGSTQTAQDRPPPLSPLAKTLYRLFFGFPSLVDSVPDTIDEERAMKELVSKSPTEINGAMMELEKLWSAPRKFWQRDYLKILENGRKFRQAQESALNAKADERLAALNVEIKLPSKIYQSYLEFFKKHSAKADLPLPENLAEIRAKGDTVAVFGANAFDRQVLTPQSSETWQNLINPAFQKSRRRYELSEEPQKNNAFDEDAFRRWKTVTLTQIESAIAKNYMSVLQEIETAATDGRRSEVKPWQKYLLKDPTTGKPVPVSEVELSWVGWDKVDRAKPPFELIHRTTKTKLALPTIGEGDLTGLEALQPPAKAMYAALSDDSLSAEVGPFGNGQQPKATLRRLHLLNETLFEMQNAIRSFEPGKTPPQLLLSNLSRVNTNHRENRAGLKSFFTSKTMRNAFGEAFQDALWSGFEKGSDYWPKRSALANLNLFAKTLKHSASGKSLRPGFWKNWPLILLAVTGSYMGGKMAYEEGYFDRPIQFVREAGNNISESAGDIASSIRSSFQEPDRSIRPASKSALSAQVHQHKQQRSIEGPNGPPDIEFKMSAETRKRLDLENSAGPFLELADADNIHSAAAWKSQETLSHFQEVLNKSRKSSGDASQAENSDKLRFNVPIEPHPYKLDHYPIAQPRGYKVLSVTGRVIDEEGRAHPIVADLTPLDPAKEATEPHLKWTDIGLPVLVIPKGLEGLPIQDASVSVVQNPFYVSNDVLVDPQVARLMLPDLEDAGFKPAHASLSQIIVKAEQEGTDLWVRDIVAALQQSSLYTYSSETAPRQGRKDNPLRPLSRFQDEDGHFCTQCTGAADFVGLHVTKALHNRPDMFGGTVSGFSPVELGIYGISVGHVQNWHRAVDSDPYILDGTPSNPDPRSPEPKTPAASVREALTKASNRFLPRRKKQDPNAAETAPLPDKDEGFSEKTGSDSAKSPGAGKPGVKPSKSAKSDGKESGNPPNTPKAPETGKLPSSPSDKKEERAPSAEASMAQAQPKPTGEISAAGDASGQRSHNTTLGASQSPGERHAKKEEPTVEIIDRKAVATEPPPLPPDFDNLPRYTLERVFQVDLETIKKLKDLRSSLHANAEFTSLARKASRDEPARVLLGTLEWLIRYYEGKANPESFPANFFRGGVSPGSNAPQMDQKVGDAVAALADRVFSVWDAQIQRYRNGMNSSVAFRPYLPNSKKQDAAVPFRLLVEESFQVLKELAQAPRHVVQEVELPPGSKEGYTRLDEYQRVQIIVDKYLSDCRSAYRQLGE